MDDFLEIFQTTPYPDNFQKIPHIGEVVFYGCQNQMWHLFTVKISYADDLVYADI